MDIPMIKKVSYLRLIPQIMFLLLINYLLDVFKIASDFIPVIFYSIIILVLYQYLIRYTLTIEHAKGIILLKKGKFAEAIEHFSNSFDFFDKHRYLDKWRSILFLNPTQYDYRELALTNMAFCYTQIGNGDKAKELYEKCLREYPKNGIAFSALNIMNSVTK